MELARGTIIRLLGDFELGLPPTPTTESSIQILPMRQLAILPDKGHTHGFVTDRFYLGTPHSHVSILADQSGEMAKVDCDDRVITLEQNHGAKRLMCEESLSRVESMDDTQVER